MSTTSTDTTTQPVLTDLPETVPAGDPPAEAPITDPPAEPVQGNEASDAAAESENEASDPETAAEEMPDAQPSSEPAEEPADDSTDVSEESEAVPVDEPSPKKKRHIGRILAIIALILLLTAGFFTVCGYLSVQGDEIEIFEPAALPSVSDSSLLSALCTVDADLSAIDTKIPGRHVIPLTYLGFIPLETTLTVSDTVAPVLTVRPLRVAAGMSITPEDFIVEVSDLTALTVSFETEPSTDTPGSGVIRILAKDLGGNVTSRETSLTVDDQLAHFSYEYGIWIEEVEAAVMSAINFDSVDFSKLDVNLCGTQRLSAVKAGIDCIFEITIFDTTPPQAKTASFDLLEGQTVSIDDFIVDITDASAVTYAYKKEPDFGRVGRQTVEIILTDAWDNQTEVTASLNIHQVPEEITVEIGTPTYEFMETLIRHLQNTSENGFPRIPDSFETDGLPVGTYTLNLIGEFNNLPVKVTVNDTEAPVLILRDVTVYKNAKPSVNDFVESCIDKSSVSYRFETEPDVSYTGTRSVTVIASDAAGNETRATAQMRVTLNMVPPVIYGVKDLTAYEGDTLSYRSGISAVDDLDGKLTVKVDASKVKTSKPGTYYVTYSATDSDGNTGTATAKVTILAISMNAAYEQADKVLAQIITKSMDDYQKARAIYDWCTKNIKYSTVTSHLMGYFAKAAYSGFKLHYGNCYTYYAVASSLLTRAGITNIEIHRNDPDNPHYWNLVSMNGSWYHFDTCPQPSPHKLEVFLLTDSQLSKFTKAGYYSFDTDEFPKTP